MNFLEIQAVEAPLPWMHSAFKGFCLDSRQLQAGQIFIALNSYAHTDRAYQFAQDALAHGAIGVISETALDISESWVCPDVRQRMGIWQRQYLTMAEPELAAARILAVTGTNGKTTISRLVAELLTLSGQACAVMGTTGNGILPELEASSHTTLDAIHLQNALHQYAQQGAKFAAIEASSHGLEQGRLSGCDIEIAAYSNLSRDHLDYHGTLEAYAEAKAQLFAFKSLKVAVINADDAYANVMLDAISHNPSHVKVLTYSTRQSADYQVFAIQYGLDGVSFHLKTREAEYQVHSPLLGHFNIENLIASLIMVEQAGYDLAELIRLVPKLQGAPGRMQVIRDAERLFVVDYAHTPDALTQVLNTLKRHVNHRLWAIFGCGGDRDRGKRPLMSQAALAVADQLILTSDNPRTEDPAQIFADMKQGINFSGHDVEEIHDRRAAIKYAVKHAQAGDIVVIAGKGHENYQEIDGVRHWFDDVVEVRGALDHSNGSTHSYPAL
ncbi:UDP-N-acetylmuramoyl-L-alanyl-D-glutamate--2,6-diaminopimelate ligase [Acinetobacter rudis]|uniref:UDP-N-acetylmuramoyl-L-alanyl-D-glutamate--2,6-diaminopimelate ligase n=1 Tax=Acinetobacter rudis TaxID=632955 RepID=A0AAW8J7P6_9GAMM|nr:UDP-N-acetylmuramoyl-L-alanyl-D-glutamate--2,6-diaminopimelate ligase [Acinetobacter rudis]MDQ8935205.1 UDP-N-acetylmuramoyl-L-alanyl-D-glutamate--2,6-diaminopimelate ligase [Acinetobacter rudis]MDQ9017073.1 UDP-N-acetylmuramoyl-L-alanyl-D-glutamate--2,6-diaminopimelate ligase [Acinetobacter rudis]